MPPRLASLDLGDIRSKQFRVGSDGVGGLYREVSLVHPELASRDRRKVGREDGIENGPVGVQPADSLERFDRGVGVGLETQQKFDRQWTKRGLITRCRSLTGQTLGKSQSANTYKNQSLATDL